MEIERKYLLKNVPHDLNHYEYHEIEQAYLCTEPVVRIRKKGDDYILTYKSKGFLEREEVELPLTEESYLHLLKKADGNIISKRRYLIPLDSSLTVELDVFTGMFQGLVLAEVEFPTTEAADSFTAPDWFGEEVTYQKTYHNSHLSQLKTGTLPTFFPR